MGSHVCDKLSDAGHDVTIVDLRPSPYLRPDQKMVTGSLLDEDLVNTVVSGADAVFDFAGLADIGESNQKPVETARINVLGNVILLEACRKAGVKRYVFASTLYVYGKSVSYTHLDVYKRQMQAVPRLPRVLCSARSSARWLVGL